jgi:formate-dependent nitrite reductase membrane component NrfD
MQPMWSVHLELDLFLAKTTRKTRARKTRRTVWAVMHVAGERGFVVLFLLLCYGGVVYIYKICWVVLVGFVVVVWWMVVMVVVMGVLVARLLQFCARVSESGL